MGTEFKINHWYRGVKYPKYIIKILASHKSPHGKRLFWLEWYNLKNMILIDRNYFQLKEENWREVPEHLITFEMI